MFSLIPRDRAFFVLFEQSAAILSKTAEEVALLMEDFGALPQRVEQIRQFEKAADEIVRTTVEKLHRSFLTPFDREDIHLLITRFDDVIDEIDSLAKRLGVYGITKPTPWLVKQTVVLHHACQSLSQAMACLREVRRTDRIRAFLVEVHHLETTGDHHHHAALTDLYATVDDPVQLMKWKDLYDIVEGAIDRCEDVADVIDAIVLKHA